MVRVVTCYGPGVASGISAASTRYRAHRPRSLLFPIKAGCSSCPRKSSSSSRRGQHRLGLKADASGIKFHGIRDNSRYALTSLPFSLSLSLSTFFLSAAKEFETCAPLVFACSSHLTLFIYLANLFSTFITPTLNYQREL